VNIAKAAGVSDQTLTRVSNIVDKVKSAAISGAAYKINGTAAFFAMPGYVTSPLDECPRAPRERLGRGVSFQEIPNET
jgi:hypothetical protein